MAARKRRKSETPRLAPRGDAAGFARIRTWANAIETAMIQRYVGNAPTLRALGLITKSTLRDIRKIKPAAISDCPGSLAHDPACWCTDPMI
jgi:hypothetical protein